MKLVISGSGIRISQLDLTDCELKDLAHAIRQLCDQGFVGKTAYGCTEIQVPDPQNTVRNIGAMSPAEAYLAGLEDARASELAQHPNGSSERKWNLPSGATVVWWERSESDLYYIINNFVRVPSGDLRALGEWLIARHGEVAKDKGETQ